MTDDKKANEDDSIINKNANSSSTTSSSNNLKLISDIYADSTNSMQNNLNLSQSSNNDNQNQNNNSDNETVYKITVKKEPFQIKSITKMDNGYKIIYILIFIECIQIFLWDDLFII